jgi:hypothetical protein
MDKLHYYFALIPPRPSFPQDITSEERALMDDCPVQCAQVSQQRANLGHPAAEIFSRAAVVCQ